MPEGLAASWLTSGGTGSNPLDGCRVSVSVFSISVPVSRCKRDAWRDGDVCPLWRRLGAVPMPMPALAPGGVGMSEYYIFLDIFGLMLLDRERCSGWVP